MCSIRDSRIWFGRGWEGWQFWTSFRSCVHDRPGALIARQVSSTFAASWPNTESQPFHPWPLLLKLLPSGLCTGFAPLILARFVEGQTFWANWPTLWDNVENGKHHAMMISNPGSAQQNMGCYTGNGFGAAFSTSMKLFHCGRKAFCPAQAL